MNNTITKHILVSKTKFFTLLVLISAGLFAFSAHASAATYYVDAARPDDTGNGQSWGAAKKTIQAGVNLLGSGDTLKIKSGTYTQGFSFVSKTFTAWTTIETDDGNGNPGTVNLTGDIATDQWGYAHAVIWNKNVEYVKIDGRRLGGFNITTTAVDHYGILFTNTDSGRGKKYAKILNIDISGVLGTDTGSDRSAIGSEMSDTEIGWCRINITDGSVVLVQMTGTSAADPNLRINSSVHDCVLQGKTGYAAISFLRQDKGLIYNNYIHGLSDNGLAGYESGFRNRQSNDNKYYNNVQWVASGEVIFNFTQSRTGSLGESLSQHVCNRNEYYNNTFINEGTATAGIMFFSDSNYNKAYNNLVIGNVSGEGFVSYWTGSTPPGSYNELYNNIVTGTVNKWFADSAIQSEFSINSNNVASAGTAFITLSGNKPYPYWDLTASKDGVTVNGLTTDYHGDVRGAVPDVGAFEYQSAGGDVTPPAAPTGVVVQ